MDFDLYFVMFDSCFISHNLHILLDINFYLIYNGIMIDNSLAHWSYKIEYNLLRFFCLDVFSLAYANMAYS